MAGRIIPIMNARPGAGNFKARRFWARKVRLHTNAVMLLANELSSFAALRGNRHAGSQRVRLGSSAFRVADLCCGRALAGRTHFLAGELGPRSTCCLLTGVAGGKRRIVVRPPAHWKFAGAPIRRARSSNQPRSIGDPHLGFSFSRPDQFVERIVTIFCRSHPHAMN